MERQARESKAIYYGAAAARTPLRLSKLEGLAFSYGGRINFTKGMVVVGLWDLRWFRTGKQAR